MDFSDQGIKKSSLSKRTDKSTLDHTPRGGKQDKKNTCLKIRSLEHQTLEKPQVDHELGRTSKAKPFDILDILEDMFSFIIYCVRHAKKSINV